MKFVLMFLLIVFVISLFFVVSNGSNPSFLTNEAFIEGLNKKINTSDIQEAFWFVFSQLEREVTVYPTENYYYFEFPSEGRIIHGSIGLFAYTIDNGKVMFAATEKQDIEPIDYTYIGSNDGLGVTKINDFRYVLNYRGKSVVFNFNQMNIDKPADLSLSSEDVFIGPSFDESGIQFYLVYNEEINNFGD